jgi:hypothetical protein
VRLCAWYSRLDAATRKTVVVTTTIARSVARIWPVGLFRPIVVHQYDATAREDVIIVPNVGLFDTHLSVGNWERSIGCYRAQHGAAIVLDGPFYRRVSYAAGGVHQWPASLAGARV